MTKRGRSTMTRQPSQIPQIFTLFLLAVFATTQPLRADTVVLDDFSTPIQFNDGRFSRSDARNDFWAPEVTIAPGVTANWYDSGGGILGGRRDVEAQNATSSTQSSMICIDGYLSVNSPSANFMSATCLSYTFAALNVEFYHKFVIDIISLDAAARGNIQGVLKLKDSSGNTAIANIAGNTLAVGRNRIELQGMQNWNGINRTNIVFSEMSFLTTMPAVDFTIDTLAFSTNPEPSTFVIIGLAFATAATLHIRKRSKLQKSD